MQIRDCMSGAVVTIAPEESAALAARLLTRHNLGALPVCGYDGQLRGIVTDGILSPAAWRQIRSRPGCRWQTS